MLQTLLIASLLAVQATAPKPNALPDTPQGRHVDAYIKAFNTGDETTFLAANEKVLGAALLAKRPAEERAKMFQRLRGDFATLRIARIVKATSTQIAFVALLKDGNEGTFTFDFEEKAPFKISRLAIDVDARERM
jgi:hypothetical protein